MTKSVWKFPVQITDVQLVWIPADAQILTAQTQSDLLCLWAMVNPAAELKEARTIAIFGTGHPIQDSADFDYCYIGTVQTNEGRIVWHVFERREKLSTLPASPLLS